MGFVADLLRWSSVDVSPPWIFTRAVASGMPSGDQEIKYKLPRDIGSRVLDYRNIGYYQTLRKVQTIMNWKIGVATFVW